MTQQTFDDEVSRGRVPHDGGSQTGRRRTLARSVDGNRSDSFNKLEQLRFGGTGITE